MNQTSRNLKNHYNPQMSPRIATYFWTWSHHPEPNPILIGKVSLHFFCRDMSSSIRMHATSMTHQTANIPGLAFWNQITRLLSYNNNTVCFTPCLLPILLSIYVNWNPMSAAPIASYSLNVVCTVIGISAMMKGQVEIGCGEARQESNTWPGEPFLWSTCGGVP